MKTPKSIRRRTRLDATIGLIYHYRYEIAATCMLAANGLMLTGALLKNWSPILDITPTVKPRRTRK